MGLGLPLRFHSHDCGQWNKPIGGILWVQSSQRWVAGGGVSGQWAERCPAYLNCSFGWGICGFRMSEESWFIVLYPWLASSIIIHQRWTRQDRRPRSCWKSIVLCYSEKTEPFGCQRSCRAVDSPLTIFMRACWGKYRNSIFIFNLGYVIYI
jgi:hypothetical protein